MRGSLAVSILAFALAGCTGMTGREAVRGTIDDAVAENDAYLTSAHEVTTMSAMVDEVDRHTSRMDVLMNDMRSDMDGMQHCARIGEMMDLRDAMQLEVDSHAMTMHALLRLVDARAEVDDHVATMGAMLGTMDMMVDHMDCYDARGMGM